MAPPPDHHHHPTPDAASHPPYMAAASSIPAQLLSLLQQPPPQQPQQQQEQRERELQAERNLGHMEAIAAFQTLLAAQSSSNNVPNVRVALQELTRMVTSTSGGQALSIQHPSTTSTSTTTNNNNSNAITTTAGGEGSNRASNTLLDQHLLRQQQEHQRPQHQASCALSSRTTNPSGGLSIEAMALNRSMPGNIKGNNVNNNNNNTAWTNTNNSMNSNDTDSELKLPAPPLSVQDVVEKNSTTTPLARNNKRSNNNKNNNNNKKQQTTTHLHQRGQHENFPEKLYRMLTELEAKGQDDIISFSAEGNTFEIHQPEVFEREIIPLYFHHNKLGSVKRQMGLYGFKRVSKAPIDMEYQHEFFRKGQPSLLSRIKRASNNNNSIKNSNHQGGKDAKSKAAADALDKNVNDS